MEDRDRAAHVEDEDDSNEAETSEEQIWNEIEAEEAGSKPPDDDQEDEHRAAEAKDGDDDSSSDDFTDDADDDPPPDDKDDEGEKKAEAADEADTNGDGKPPAGADPKALEVQVNRLQEKLKSNKGRLQAARQEIAQLQRQIAEAEKSPSRASGDDATLKDRKDRLKAAREEYGDVIGPLAETIEDLQSRVDQLTAKETQDLAASKERYQTLVQAERQTFLKEHPDGFDTIVKNRKVFDAWIDDQPRELRDIYAANRQVIVDGEQSALLVGKFKQALLGADRDGTPDTENPEQKRLQSRRQQQLRGAKAIDSKRGQRVQQMPRPDSDDPEEIWKYFDEKERRDAARG